MNRVVSVHWGFSIGGVAKYSMIIDRVNEYTNIEIHSIVILSPGVHIDENTMNSLYSTEIIRLRSKLDPSWLWKLRRALVSNNASLVMTHGFNAHFLMMVQKYILRVNLPLVSSYHGKYHATTRLRKAMGIIYNRLTEFYIRRCVIGAVSVAHYCKTFLIERNVDPHKITVIHNGISNIQTEERRRNLLRKEWEVGDDELLMGIASRIDPVKGVEYLISAFAYVLENHKNIKLVIVGTGTLENDLKKLVSKNNMNKHVIFSGFRSDIQDCLGAMDIFVLPSLAEYHSIGLLEAMRAEKAIITTSVGGNTESVRNMKEALIVPPADSKKLSSAINTMIEDPDLRIRLAQAARERFTEYFTEDNTARLTAEWLDKQLSVAGTT